MSARSGAGAPAFAGTHQQAMDRMYRFQRHIYDASRRYYLLGRDGLIADLDVAKGGTVLELGCGTGRNLVQVACRYPLSKVYGVDLSSEMLKTAGASLIRHDLSGQVSLAEGDALTFEGRSAFDMSGFDRVMFSYTLSMIPQWKQALANAALLVAPGGSLHVVDFGQCEELPRIFKRALFTWLGLFHVTPRRELLCELHAVARRHGGTFKIEIGHRGYCWHGVIRFP